ncbi:MAG: PQQ-binding-like beta-propeller repeat protein [Planctomycetales bacterium]|nr:PQQ-binding-like beta-propeller repeat protein [Planctomycetales bacterium]
MLFGVGSTIARAENWPNWRGPNRDGVSSETDLPTTWSASEGVLWKTPLPGPAGATPVIWGDRIFLTSAAENDLALLCLDNGGNILWQKSVASGNQDVRGDEGNSAAPSPCTDGEHVWAFMATGDWACFDFAGNEVWRFNLQDRYGKFNIQFGMTPTPILDGDRLYFHCMYTGAAYVLAIDKLTGAEVWKVDRPSDARAECEHSYASPTIYRDGERAMLISHGADYVVGHSLDDGSEIFRCGGLNPPGDYNPTLRFVASPVTSEGIIVVPSAKNGPVLGISPTASGDITAGGMARVWEREHNTPDVPSPLVHDGLVYLCRENGGLICLDAATGEEIYYQPTHRERHRASPVYGDGKVYLTARDGRVTVVRAGRAFEILAENDITPPDGPPVSISASPAVSAGRIYLRTFDSLIAIGAK